MADAPIEGGSEETYARYADIYDALFDDIHDDVGFYLKRAGAPGDGRILELGAGTGRVTEPLLQAGYRVTAVDLSPEMLAKATARLAPHAQRIRVVCADARNLALGERYSRVFAPYGMVAHLVSDDDRRAAFRGVYDHLEPGGAFVFDDRPSWLAGPADGMSFVHLRTRLDPASGRQVRLSTNCVDLAKPPVTLRYDFIDWLEAGQVARRVVVRIVLRNVPLEDDLAMLEQVGFRDFELCGDFEGAPLDRRNLATNKRLIVSCRRPS
jgi:SAM-dependent methyltransferase